MYDERRISFVEVVTLYNLDTITKQCRGQISATSRGGRGILKETPRFEPRATTFVSTFATSVLRRPPDS